MAEINSEVGGFSHPVEKSRRGKKVLAWEHRNLIVPVADFFFPSEEENMYCACCTLKKELPCSDNRELNCRQYCVIQLLGMFLVL